MSDMQINAVLGQIRSLRAQLEQPQGATPPAPEAASGFGAVLGRFLEQVNDAQAASADLAARFEQGDERVSLAQVMVAGQKASVSFQAAVQVRNKLLAAYQDVMNMQI
ncbi:MAG: flagellar hook-basal body complex protein FliE [Immundisolibacter sp.]